jgi:hypothetical protein
LDDRELLVRAAKAAGIDLQLGASGYFADGRGGLLQWIKWDPREDDGDLYRLARKLGISIDFADCCAWKRLPSGELIQEWWGGESGDEAHAVLRAAAEIGKKVDAPPWAS